MLPDKMTAPQIMEDTVNVTNNAAPVKDYGIILDTWGLTYKEAGYYWQVGDITPVQGWMLHISVISCQVVDVLKLVIPTLVKVQVPFKIAKDEVTANSLLAGLYGYVNLAKIVSIYPETDAVAQALANELIALTSSFKGPDIPTDLRLGGQVYTRYGSFSPIVKPGLDGRMEQYIYNSKGELVRDDYVIPFQLLVDIHWPFTAICPPFAPPRKKFLNDCIRPVKVLKPDMKGRVIKGSYFKSFFQVKACLVKQGKRGMCADEWGRDIQDRLQWQWQLHNALAGQLNMPAPLDFFEEQGDCYMAMEFVQGISFAEKIVAVYKRRAWPALLLKERLCLTDHLLDVLHIIQQLHQQGYVHRDITPGNFLIDKHNQLYILDFELTYSIAQRFPDPPFGLATAGYMSPEQLAGKTPTVKEDIYALGALMIAVFTGLTPLKFETNFPDALRHALHFFIPDPGIVTLIAQCLDADPAERPDISILQERVLQFRQGLAPAPVEAPLGRVADHQMLKIAIEEGLNGLVSEWMTYERLWISKEVKINQLVGNQQNSSALYPGMYEGISGVLYVLSHIKGSGLALDDTIEAYWQHNMAYLRQQYLGALDGMPPGLYLGSAGMALMLGSGIRSGLLQDTATERAHIQACLNREPVALDLVSGAAGQGLAILQCLPWLPAPFATAKLQQLVSLLLEQQRSNGAWIIQADEKQPALKVSGLALGSGGIILFLLAYADKFNNELAKQAAIRGLQWLQHRAYKVGDAYTWNINSLAKQRDAWLHLGDTGIAFTFIKAYELLGNAAYRKMAEGALRGHPAHVMHADFSQAWGLSGLGEVYLEAARVFKAEEWKQRADWIAASLLHLRKRISENACYWLADADNSFPTADYMSGNSGIIHFLARRLMEDKLSYPLLCI